MDNKEDKPIKDEIRKKEKYSEPYDTYFEVIKYGVLYCNKCGTIKKAIYMTADKQFLLECQHFITYERTKNGTKV